MTTGGAGSPSPPAHRAGGRSAWRPSLDARANLICVFPTKLFGNALTIRSPTMIYIAIVLIHRKEAQAMTMVFESPLPQRALGSTGLMVHPLCIGCAELGDMPETFAYSVAEEQALATIRAIFAGPVNFLDTAASYGDGESERRLGIVLRELGGLPPAFVLASKADRDLKTGDFSGPQMRRSVERSLRLLGLDQLQLLYLHDPEHTTFEQAMSAGGPVETLQRCQQEGLIA